MTREDAISILNVIVHMLEPKYDTDRVEDAVDMAIKALEQEPKTGHWILDETDNSITCNKCGCLMWANDICHGDAHYCPNCGARMESEARDEQK